MSDRSRKIVFALSLLGLAIAGPAILLFCTPWGVGLTPDSAMYIGGADGIARGKGHAMLVHSGEYRPIATYMPGYSVAIAAVSRFGPAPLDAARYTQAILFGLNIALAGVAVYLATRRAAPALVAAGLTILAPDILRVHAYAWSESLFILLVIGAAFTLSRHLDRPNIAWVIVCGVLLGLVFLARYMGLAYVIAASASIVLQSRRPWRRRILDVAIVCTIAALAVLYWGARNRALNRDVAARPILWHPITIKHLKHAGWSLARWAVPEGARSVPAIAGGLAAAGIVGAVVYRRRRADHQPRPSRSSLPPLSVIWIAVYMISVVGGITFLDFGTLINFRILAPALACAIVGCCAAWPRGKLILAPLGAGLLVSWSVGAFDYFSNLRTNGLGYAAPMWKQSQTLRAVHRLPKGVLIYTNAWDVIWLLDLRPAQTLPGKRDGVTGGSNQAYDPVMKQIADDVATGRAVIVLFDNMNRETVPTEKQIRAMMPLRVLDDRSDGVVLCAPDAPLP